jgi:cation diffusion facilitator family transporter
MSHAASGCRSLPAGRIGGSYLVWRWLHEGVPRPAGLLGGFILICYGIIPALQTTAGQSGQSAVVFIRFRLSRRPASERYPYGLERAKDLTGIGIAIVIWASAAFAGAESIRKLLERGHTTDVGWGGAAVGIIGNQAAARYKLTVGRRIGSATLIADARHFWLDALSSAGALAGLVAVAAGRRACGRAGIRCRW